MAKDESNLPARTSEQRPGLKTWAFGLDKPSLTARPQRLGVLPSIRFWNRIDTFKYQVPALAAGIGVGFAIILLLGPLTALLGPVVALAIVMPFAVLGSVLPLGLFERWLRKEIARRAAGGHDDDS